MIIIKRSENPPMLAKGEPIRTSQKMWTTPTSQGTSPRPVNLHSDLSYSMSEGFEDVQVWDASTLSLQQTPSDTTVSPRPISMHQEFYPAATVGSNVWTQKPCDDSLDMNGLHADLSNIGQAYTTDEAIPIIDLRFQEAPAESGGATLNGNFTPRRISGSSFTMSTSGGVSDMQSYEDYSTAMSDAPSFSSEFPPSSNRNSLLSSKHLSPVASPRMTPQSRSELVRTQSRGRASPSPRPVMRSAPYSVENSRAKRWSTGSYGTAQNRRQSPLVHGHQTHHDPYGAHVRMTSRHSSPTAAQTQLPLNFGNLQAVAQQQHNTYFLGGTPAFQRNSMLLPSQLPSQFASQGFNSMDPHHHHAHHPFEAPPTLMSHGLFRMLQSNGDPHTLHGHCADLSEPPDLFASLHEEQIPPPPEDMNPSDPELTPHEQELRFEGDLYTPRWVRGHGNKREGWCGICKPGRWLVLKNSAYWYDKSFTHGISAATGNPFQEPQETRRMDGNPDAWEGLCGSCNEWIALVSSKKKGTTWFRHAYKCHTHPKIKDAPKRRRENSHSRVLAASQMAKPKTEPHHTQPHQRQQEPPTPQLTPAAMSVTMAEPHTPAPAPAPTPAHLQLVQPGVQTPGVISRMLTPVAVVPMPLFSHSQLSTPPSPPRSFLLQQLPRPHRPELQSHQFPNDVTSTPQTQVSRPLKSMSPLESFTNMI